MEGPFASSPVSQAASTAADSLEVSNQYFNSSLEFCDFSVSSNYNQKACQLTEAFKEAT